MIHSTFQKHGLFSVLLILQSRIVIGCFYSQQDISQQCFTLAEVQRCLGSVNLRCQDARQNLPLLCRSTALKDRLKLASLITQCVIQHNPSGKKILLENKVHGFSTANIRDIDDLMYSTSLPALFSLCRRNRAHVQYALLQSHRRNEDTVLGSAAKLMNASHGLRKQRITRKMIKFENDFMDFSTSTANLSTHLLQSSSIAHSTHKNFKRFRSDIIRKLRMFERKIELQVQELETEIVQIKDMVKLLLNRMNSFQHRQGFLDIPLNFETVLRTILNEQQLNNEASKIAFAAWQELKGPRNGFCQVSKNPIDGSLIGVQCSPQNGNGSFDFSRNDAFSRGMCKVMEVALSLVTYTSIMTPIAEFMVKRNALWTRFCGDRQPPTRKSITSFLHLPTEIPKYPLCIFLLLLLISVRFNSIQRALLGSIVVSSEELGHFRTSVEKEFQSFRKQSRNPQRQKYVRKTTRELAKINVKLTAMDKQVISCLRRYHNLYTTSDGFATAKLFGESQNEDIFSTENEVKRIYVTRTEELSSGEVCSENDTCSTFSNSSIRTGSSMSVGIKGTSTPSANSVSKAELKGSKTGNSRSPQMFTRAKRKLAASKN